MKKLPVYLLLLALTLSQLPATSTQALTQNFTEDFGTTAYQDTANTTAHWDTYASRLKLPTTEPVVTSAVGRLGSNLAEFPAVYVPEQGKAYLIGGGNNISHQQLPSARIVQYDPARNVIERTMNAALPTGRDSCTAAYASAVGKIYIFGGQDRDQGYRDILRFDPVADTLATLPVQLPYRLRDAASAYVPGNNKIYIFGGITPDRINPDILCFDVATETLQVLTVKLPTGRASPAAAFVPEQNRIYLFGGYSSTGVV
ncbi:MAG: hypothetical protein FJ026_13075, partial [Chloroflexi bacterium]|nr:hypothetical protein [Chloroflexota bacterium]